MSVSAEQIQIIRVQLTWDEVVAAATAVALERAKTEIDLRSGLYLVSNPGPLKANLVAPNIVGPGYGTFSFEITGKPDNYLPSDEDDL